MTTKDQRLQRDRQIVTMALEGTGHAVSADAVGLGKSTVSYICRKYGLHCRPRSRSAHGKKRNDEIRSLVSAGVDTNKIADRFGLSRSRITQICIEGGMRRRMKRTKTNGNTEQGRPLIEVFGAAGLLDDEPAEPADNSFGSRPAESFPGMGDIAQIDHDRAERMLEAWRCGDTTRLEASDGILLAFANQRDEERRGECVNCSIPLDRDSPHCMSHEARRGRARKTKTSRRPDRVAEPPAPAARIRDEAHGNAPPAPETQAEHPEARRWRMQLCEEQGRRFKLERENKAMRGVLAATLQQVSDLEQKIEDHLEDCETPGAL